MIASQVPFIDVTNAALDFWKKDQLPDAEALLTRTIMNPGHIRHHALANRALVRAYMQHWDAAIDDAKKVGPAYSFLSTSLFDSKPLQVYRN